MKLRILLAVVIVAASWYFWLPIKPTQIIDSTNKEEVLVPDFTATLLHQEMFDINGNLTQEVFSQKMEHFAALELTYFEQPEFVIYQNKKPFWRLSAQNGNVQDGRLILDKNVTMYQVENNQMVTTIDTDYLEINLDSQLVWTDKPIVIKGKQSIITGKGMKADLKVGKVQLTEHVRTIIKGS